MVSHSDRIFDEDMELVELTRYPNKAEADLLMPLLEDADIPAEIEELLETGEPAGAMRVLVAASDLDLAQQIYEEHEADREKFRSETAAEPEPAKVQDPREKTG